MAVFIYQENSLALMAQLEGPEWLAQQSRQTESPYAFPLWLEAWQLKVAAGHAEDDLARLEDYVFDRFQLSVQAVIYGKGGFHRYIVRPNGEILFAASSAIAAKRPEAQALGFTLC